MKLKGVRDDLELTLAGANWAEMIADLTSQLERPRSATDHPDASFWLEAAESPPSLTELERMFWLLAMHNLRLEGWTEGTGFPRPGSESTETDASGASSTENAPYESSLDGRAEGDFQDPRENRNEAAFLAQTLRSGEMIHHDGTVVVLGDVNPGAVVVAEGNVIVWGRLRGVVHAGASGNSKAVVGALELAPSELRIGGHIARAPDVNGSLSGGAELARVRNGRIVIEDWDDGKV
jgi:septum site-determining protein MinC